MDVGDDGSVGFLEVVWVFSGRKESRRVKTLFPQRSVSVWKNRITQFLSTQFVFLTGDVDYCHPVCYHSLLQGYCAWDKWDMGKYPCKNPCKITVRWFL